MRIVVFNLPATSGGALSILESFYNDVKNYKDPSIEWYFILSTPTLKNYKNIKVKNYPWVKKSWFHRVYFDKIYSKKLLSELNPDKLFSMQNTSINGSYKQAIYLHQGLVLSKYKFKFMKNRKLWIYQNIIGKLILNSLKKADKIIVQTKWMKTACLKKISMDASKIKVIPPSKSGNTKGSKTDISKTFFYPSSDEEYKNHEIIIRAVELVKEKSEEKFEVILTLDPKNNPRIRKLYEYTQKKKLPIVFKGVMKKNDVMEMYEKSTLLFPSYIESFGLPLLEAQEKEAIVLAADEPYAREVLNNYPNAYYFKTFNAEMLADLMLSVINQKYKVKESSSDNNFVEKEGLVEEIIKF